VIADGQVSEETAAAMDIYYVHQMLLKIGARAKVVNEHDYTHQYILIIHLSTIKFKKS